MSAPGDIAPDVTELNLDNNDNSVIRPTDFNDKYPNFNVLYLRTSGITSIESGCFEGTTIERDLQEVSSTLTKLNVNSNEITGMEVDELSYLAKLTYLSLSSNRLSTLPNITQCIHPLGVLELTDNLLNCCSSNVWLKQIRTVTVNVPITLSV
ncbi:hypothetical protein CAPTEDRAFT_186806 [Capitella teleta]|uniref:U2A'/phosphoprotein 32 family A C-terminal domain-containing protein n=1 Tax=Capitella teleta TaxID=283909 RepID=R7T378_CAPTE|nr:hypothetical protein CAPTEDRAFT_186806 [Capitella teleta]|eukprot:ELT87021.1 hypothetical protein CAPTEDRAFT_186806 [Capitella teleta]